MPTFPTIENSKKPGKHRAKPLSGRIFYPHALEKTHFCFAGSEKEWTQEEKENLSHFKRCTIAQSKVRKAANREDVIRLLKEALAESKVVRDDVLAKFHPDLPKMYRHKWVKGTTEMLRLVEAGHVSGPDAEGVDKVFAEWEEWLKTHDDELRFPIGLPD